MRGLLRCLMLVCGLTLALPPGWCCMVQVWADPQVVAQETSHPPCCARCPVPASTKTPAPRSVPLAPGKCPCDYRHSAAPDVLKVVAGDLTLATPLPLLDLVPAWLGTCGTVTTFVFTSDISLQLLHRVWLC